MKRAVQSGAWGSMVLCASFVGWAGSVAAQTGDAPAEADVAGDPTLESGDAQARAHFQAAADAFQIADYALARREYERAFELSGRPEMMYQLYLCDERLGNLEGAIAWLERYLLEAPDVPRRETLVARLTTMRERAAEAEPPDVIESPETTQVPDLSPEPELPHRPRSAPPPSANVPQASSTRPADPALGFGISLLSVAALGFIASATTGGLGLREQDRLAEECMFDVCPGSARGIRNDAEGLFFVADVLWVSALAVSAVGVVLTVLGLTSEEGS